VSEHPTICADCRAPLTKIGLSDLCVPCQERSIKWGSDPANFEGKRWKWEERWYAVVHMATGAIQTRTISRSREQAWLRFGAHLGSVRADYMALGYRVKAIDIKPAWTTKK